MSRKRRKARARQHRARMRRQGKMSEIGRHMMLVIIDELERCELLGPWRELGPPGETYADYWRRVL